MIERAKETEPHGYLRKPVNDVDLRTTVEIALYKHQLEQARAEKAQSDRAVHESNESFRVMIEAVKDYAIVMLEADGRIASWNVGAERLEGYCKQEIIRQHFSKLYTSDEVAVHKPEQELETAARLGRTGDQGWRVRKDGTQFFADVVITAVYDPGGRLRGFSKVTRIRRSFVCAAKSSAPSSGARSTLDRSSMCHRCTDDHASGATCARMASACRWTWW